MERSILKCARGAAGGPGVHFTRTAIGTLRKAAPYVLYPSSWVVMGGVELRRISVRPDRCICVISRRLYAPMCFPGLVGFCFWFCFRAVT